MRVGRTVGTRPMTLGMVLDSAARILTVLPLVFLLYLTPGATSRDDASQAS